MDGTTRFSRPILQSFSRQDPLITSCSLVDGSDIFRCSAESEVFSLDADLRMDGIPALDLWNLIIDVMHSNSNQKQKDKQARGILSRSKALKKFNFQFNTPVSQGYLELSNDDFVPSNVNSCHKGTMLYIFEDNEAVIKMIMKGRRHTLRRISRNHRITLDWLFDRITFDPKIQIRCVKSTNSLTCWRKGISPLNGYVIRILSSTSMWRHQKNTIFFLPNKFLFKERVNKRLRMMLNRPSGDNMDDIDTHSLTWQYSWLRQCAQPSFLEKMTPQNLHVIRNTDEKPTVKKLFDVTQRLIQEQRLEIPGVSEISSATSLWERLSLNNDEEIINLSKAKVYVFSDSVLCLGKVRPFPQSNDEWRAKLEWFMQRIGYNRWRTNGVRVDDGSRAHCVAHSPRDPKNIEGLELWTRATQKEESSSCRCTTTSCGENHKTNEYVLLMSSLWLLMQRSSLRVIGLSSDQDLLTGHVFILI